MAVYKLDYNYYYDYYDYYFCYYRFRCGYCRDIFDAMFPVITAAGDVIIQQGAFFIYVGDTSGLPAACMPETGTMVTHEQGSGRAV